jgi:hypothetical protein
VVPAFELPQGGSLAADDEKLPQGQCGKQGQQCQQPGLIELELE